MEHLPLSALNYAIVQKISIAILFGFSIGLERELTNKFAGLRTHILVCLGSTVFTILSIYVFPQIYAHGNQAAFGDPARIAAQILTGIGFIGAGTVLRNGPSVFGLTTAATLWTTASIGMATGAGEFFLAGMTTLLTVIVLTSIRAFEHLVLKKFTFKSAKIKATIILKPENTTYFIDEINKIMPNICEFKSEKSERDCDFDKITIVFCMYTQNPIKELNEKIKSITEIETIHLKEVYPE
jgi:putative Mg2+ transporter-C (MgtC) family protein